MGKYYSGCSLKESFKLDRELLYHAIYNEIFCGETEENFIYEPCSKEQACAFILGIYDEAVYQCLQANRAASVLEDILHEHTNLTDQELLQLFVEGMTPLQPEETENIILNEDSENNIIRFPKK